MVRLKKCHNENVGNACATVSGSSRDKKIRLLMMSTIGSIVGIVVGLVPGAGGQIAGLVAYDQSRKFSKTRETYGKGEPEGLIAAETANNAMVGPSLVPLLTLSVPGSPTAAVLLGGLLIHGIFPGPSLFTDYPEVSWTFINSLLVGQVLMVVLGLALARLAAKVIMLPEHYLAAAVVVLAVFGTYSVQHSYSDVLIMATLGGGMWFFEKYGFSAAPLVLGIVLGPIAEQNFVYGRTIAEAGDGILPYFFGGGLNIALVTLIILSVLGSAVLEMRARRKSSLVVA
jgi:putative tricarboxylic transport membrane protein